MGIFFAKPIESDPVWPLVTTPTMTNPDALFPAANLLSYDPTQVARASATTTVITWDFGLARFFDVVSLLYTNFDIDAMMAIDGSNDGSAWTSLSASARALAHVIGTPAKSATESDTDQRKGKLLKNATLYNSATLQSWRYIRITIDVIAGVPIIGRLFVGRKFVPSTKWQYGSSFDFQDNSKRDRTDQGAMILAPQKPIVSANVKMEFLNKTEMYDYIYDFNYWRGSAQAILACLDDEDVARLQKNILYCTIAEGRRISFDSYNTHSSTWTLESLA